MPHFTGNPSYSIPSYSSSGARKGRESSAVGTIALTVFPAVSISRFRLPGSVAEGDCQTRSALEGLTLHAAAARHARMRRSPNLQCQSGRPALGSSRSQIANPSKRVAFRRNLQLDETVAAAFARLAGRLRRELPGVDDLADSQSLLRAAYGVRQQNRVAQQQVRCHPACCLGGQSIWFPAFSRLVDCRDAGDVAADEQ